MWIFCVSLRGDTRLEISLFFDTAELTGNFIFDHMYSGIIVLYGVNTKTYIQGISLAAYNTGYYVEALAALANITSNTTWSNMRIRFPHLSGFQSDR